MRFKETMHGYDKQQVDEYISTEQSKYEDILSEQKDRIFHLAEENYVLSEQVKKYKTEEDAISRALIDSQRVAKEYQHDAEKFSAIALQRAKVFYATWQTYAKAITDSFSETQMREFNALSKKIEKIIMAYQDKKSATTVAKPTPANPDAQLKYENPITKVEKAAEVKPVVDLKELQSTTATLQELCKQLGIKVD